MNNTAAAQQTTAAIAIRYAVCGHTVTLARVPMFAENGVVNGTCADCVAAASAELQAAHQRRMGAHHATRYKEAATRRRYGDRRYDRRYACPDQSDPCASAKAGGVCTCC